MRDLKEKKKTPFTFDFLLRPQEGDWKWKGSYWIRRSCVGAGIFSKGLPALKSHQIPSRGLGQHRCAFLSGATEV